MRVKNNFLSGLVDLIDECAANLSQHKRVKCYGNSPNLNPGALTRMKQQVTCCMLEYVKICSFQFFRKMRESYSERRKWPHNFNIFSVVVSDMDNVCGCEKNLHGGSIHKMEDLYVNGAIERMFARFTLQSNSNSLCQDYD